MKAFGGTSSHGIIGQLASNEIPKRCGSLFKGRGVPDRLKSQESRLAIDQPYGLPLLDMMH